MFARRVLVGQVHTRSQSLSKDTLSACATFCDSLVDCYSVPCFVNKAESPKSWHPRLTFGEDFIRTLFRRNAGERSGTIENAKCSVIGRHTWDSSCDRTGRSKVGCILGPTGHISCNWVVCRRLQVISRNASGASRTSPKVCSSS